MDRFLIDSDIVIWFLKGRKKEVELLEELSKKGKLFCLVVTITEVRVGLRKKPQEVIADLTKIFFPLEVNLGIAELAGAFKQKYQLDIADMFIAATAASENLPLVTYNKKHFPMSEVKLYLG